MQDAQVKKSLIPSLLYLTRRKNPLVYKRITQPTYPCVHSQIFSALHSLVSTFQALFVSPHLSLKLDK